MPTPDHTAHLTALLAEIEYATWFPGLALPALPACALCQGEADHIGVWAPEPPLVAEYLAARARRGLTVPADGACPTTVYCFCHSCLRKPYALKRVQAKLRTAPISDWTRRRSGKSVSAGVRETFAKGNLLRLHAGEDVIAGAVEDAVDARDLIAGEAVAQRLDDRNAAGNRRLEAERRALGLGELGEMKPVLGDQRLVGRDDGLAVAERRLDRGIGHAIRAADQFDKDIDVGRARQRHGIAEPGKAGEIDVARLVAALRRDRGDSDMAPRSRRQSGGLTVEKLDERGADGAKAGDAETQGRRHPKIQLNRRNPGHYAAAFCPISPGRSTKRRSQAEWPPATSQAGSNQRSASPS